MFKIFLAAVLIWVFFSPLSVQPNTHLGKVMRESRVMTVIDTFAPNAAQKIPEMLDDSARTASLQQMTDRSSRFAGSGIPDENIVETPAIVKARRSVVKIVGEATDCHRRLEGTGFIYSPGLVVTNAHVVAGARIIRVHTVKGVFRARPIVFNAMRDVAVLWVPDISSNRLVLRPFYPLTRIPLRPVRLWWFPASPIMALTGWHRPVSWNTSSCKDRASMARPLWSGRRMRCWAV
ncbi:MAG: trypsin-like peptidase domain-containing protein [Lawsonella clevelandensis]